MKINEKNYHSVWRKSDDSDVIVIIDQRSLPHRLIFEELASTDQVATAIKEMHLRGAPLIGIVAAFGVYYAFKESFQNKTSFSNAMTQFDAKITQLKQTRPTAINLEWAIQKQQKTLQEYLKQGEHLIENTEAIQAALATLFENGFHILHEDIELCRQIGENGLQLIEAIAKNKPGKTINILTHCNAGWLATGDFGTATSPMYLAHDKGLPIHVYVDETRPRNQGARLTAWELGQHGIPHTVISDNTGGHLMQHGLVDICFVGSDRTSRQGDVANKIGTYLKALAAKDNNVPFYVCLPYSTFDFQITDGVKEIPIEERGSEEVKYIQGLSHDEVHSVLLTPESSPAMNFGFDVTPARLISGLVTERGICDASIEGIKGMYSDLM